jgi:uncharacterized membrane protein
LLRNRILGRENRCDTIVLSLIFLFVVLFYIYPLKFLFTFLLSGLIGSADAEPGREVLRAAEIPSLMVIYSIGFVAVFFLFFLLYLHAYRRRDALGLDGLESAHTRFSMQAQLIHVAVGMVSILMAAIGGPRLAPWAGMIYGLIGPCRMAHGIVAGREIDRLRAGIGPDGLPAEEGKA